MNPISHTQARRLIQQQFDDRHLHEAQWTALQSHLEGCAECRAYHERLTSAERAARRALRARWDSVDGPLEATAPALVELFHERKSVRRMGVRTLGGAGLFLLAALLLVAWSAGLLKNLLPARQAAAPTLPPITNTLAPTPSPTREPSEYRGVVLHEQRAGGAGDIFLLNTGAEPANLTSHPANDHAPAWSPDGNWIAFLSDRGGQDEVYVMTIAGTRLTQLTALPGVTWRGPISWSADGQMLALIGERMVGEQKDTWVYLLPLDGSNAYTLGYSAGATLAVFSPNAFHRWLAFTSEQFWENTLVVYNMDPERENFQAVDVAHTPQTDGPDRVVGLLDWSADGTRILYRVDARGAEIATGEQVDRTELRAATVSDDAAGYQVTTRVITSYGPPGGFPSASWTGIQDEYAYLTQPDPSGCQALRMSFTSVNRFTEVPGLCVEAGLARANWRVGEKSLLVKGWTPDRPSERGLFVVRFIDKDISVEWISPVDETAGPPLLRPPSGKPLAIDPQPVRPAGPKTASPLPGPETGDLLATSTLNDRTLIERLDPASPRRTLINQSVGQNQCPTWSPDRDRIAFLSDREGRPSVTEIYVMDGSGLNARRLTEPVFPYRVIDDVAGEVYPRYGCPVWSADGQWLAAPVYTPGGYIAFLPLDEKDGPPRYLPNPTGLSLLSIDWLADGRLLAGFMTTTGQSITLRAFDPRAVENRKSAPGEELLKLEGAGYLTGLSIAPDGRRLALFLMEMPIQGSENADPTYRILAADLPAGPGQPLTVQYDWSLADFDGYTGTSVFGWLPDGRLAYLLRYPPGRRVKAEVFIIDPSAQRGGAGPGEAVASYEETVLSAAWSADGRWLSVITEAGRSVLNIDLAPMVVPAQVDGARMLDLRW